MLVKAIGRDHLGGVMSRLEDYSSKVQAILRPHEGGERLMPLAPRGPLRGEGLEMLVGTTAEELFDGTEVAAPEFADCVRSALFLYFSDLDRSHTISQSIHSTTGSFLHGIMHRQEPDFSNAKYWFREVPTHEVFAALREAALERWAAAGDSRAESLRVAAEGRPAWDAFWFVDQCEAVSRGGASEMEAALQEAQRIEWQMLFDYCYRRAVGEGA